VIRISQTTYDRLEQHVSGFGDNPDTIIQRLLDYYENNGEQTGSRQQPEVYTEDDTLMLDPSNPVDLTHARTSGGYFDEEEVSNWAELLHAAHRIAYRKLGSFNKVSEVTQANIAKGEQTELGFSPVVKTSFSIQGANANNSWESAFRLARELRVPIEMRFRWANKEKAIHPGKKAVLSWEPNS